MKCTEKERESCNVEKMGCIGCFYNNSKIPKFYKGMKLVKCYDTYALYEDEIHKECFKYSDLIKPKEHKITRDIEVNYHL